MPLPPLATALQTTLLPPSRRARGRGKRRRVLRSDATATQLLNTSFSSFCDAVTDHSYALQESAAQPHITVLRSDVVSSHDLLVELA